MLILSCFWVGLGYSAVSRCVSSFKNLFSASGAFAKGYNRIESLIINQDVTPIPLTPIPPPKEAETYGVQMASRKILGGSGDPTRKMHRINR